MKFRETISVYSESHRNINTLRGQNVEFFIAEAGHHKGPVSIVRQKVKGTILVFSRSYYGNPRKISVKIAWLWNPGPTGYEVGVDHNIVVFVIMKPLTFDFASDFGIELVQCVLFAVRCFLLQDRLNIQHLYMKTNGCIDIMRIMSNMFFL
jgi:hypothetical protein